MPNGLACFSFSKPTKIKAICVKGEGQRRSGQPWKANWSGGWRAGVAGQWRVEGSGGSLGELRKAGGRVFEAMNPTAVMNTNER